MLDIVTRDGEFPGLARGIEDFGFLFG